MGNISGGDASTHLSQDITKNPVNIPGVKVDGEDLSWDGEWSEVVSEVGLPQLNAPGPVTAENREAMELVIAILKAPNRSSVDIPESCTDVVKEVFANYGDVVDGKLSLKDPPPPVMEVTPEENAEQ
eukprot:TRINITY_DN24275_c0_g1_i1.p1 TRINITY_DN24275_c0_g1~~TRINITY_DN24275_c0_g1_i1.p1  ORF type:complete len:145 (+),score=42.80 TRINITY_DN24275_c0_g1_i1:57-437(+)